MIHVNEAVIEEKAVLEEMQYHPATSQRDAMFQAAEALIIGELLKQRAAELGLELQDANAPANDDDFLDQLIEKEVDVPEAGEQECRTYFEQNRDKFTTSPLMEAKHILLAAPPGEDKPRMEALTIAEELIKQLKAGGDFAGLAKAYSACPSKETGGSLGQLSKGQTVPEFERVVFTLEPGLYDAPVESRYGFHIVWVERKVAGLPLEFMDVREKIRDYLNEKVRHKAIAQYIHTLIAGAKIEGYDFSVSTSPLMQ